MKKPRHWGAGQLGGIYRGLRGGSYGGDSGDQLSSSRVIDTPTSPFNDIGFRVASVVPEPSTGMVAIIACGLMWWWRKRFK